MNDIETLFDHKETWWDKVTLPFYRTFYFVRDIPHKLRFRFVYRHYLVKMPRIGKYSWCDTDHRLVHANFELLKQFVDHEKPFDIVDWKSDKGHRKAGETIKELYIWWNDYPRREKEIEYALDDWYKNRNKAKGNALFAALHQLEKDFEEETTKNLHRLIDIKDYLWT